MKKVSFKNTTIRRRIFVTYGLLFVIALVTAGYTIYAVNNIGQLNARRDSMIEARKAARSLDVDVLRIIVNLQYFTDTADPKYLANTEIHRREADQLRSHLRNMTTSSEVLQLLDKYEAILPERRALASDIVVAIQNDQPEARVNKLVAQRRQLDDQARGYLRAIIDAQESDAAGVLLETDAYIAATKQRVVWANIPLLVLMIVFGVLLSRSITKPLAKIERLTKRIGQGDFSPTEVSVGTDEVSQLERSMGQMTHELAELERSKSEFISLVSHQLRTPATAVKQSLGLIVEGYVDDEPDKRDQLTKMAYDSNEEQLEIVDDILNVAKIDAGKLEIKKESVELNAIVQTAVSLLEHDAKDKGQTLQLNTTEQSLDVMVDSLKISMVIENLVSNAIKYTPEHGTIEVTVTKQADGVCVAVRDTGIGIDATDMDKLFTKFGRLQTDYTAKVQGTGLGLYLVKKFIDMHGGTIEVTSARNKGTTFSVTLPKE